MNDKPHYMLFKIGMPKEPEDKFFEALRAMRDAARKLGVEIHPEFGTALTNDSRYHINCNSCDAKLTLVFQQWNGPDRDHPRLGTDDRKRFFPEEIENAFRFAGWLPVDVPKRFESWFCSERCREAGYE
jgi:hypothetical protein